MNEINEIKDMNKKEENQCHWILYPNKRCQRKALKNYCSIHKKYEDLFHPDELTYLVWCKKCKQRSRQEDIDYLNRCEKCVAKQRRDIEARKLKRSNPCCWLNQKGNPCSWSALPNQEFCKRHSVYKDKFTKEDIKFLKQCSACKNMFKPSHSEKTCEQCHLRGKQYRREQRQIHIQDGLCKGIIRATGKPCTFKPVSNDEYCEKHQTYKKWKKLTDRGKKICKNWIRGCFQELNPSIKSSLCSKCKYLTNNQKLSVDVYKQRLTLYKAGAKQRDIEWKLTDDCVNSLFTSPCYYCNYYDGRTGIDRLDSTQGYISSNVVSCCTVCNQMKLCHSQENFIKLVSHLCSSMNLVSDNYNYSYLFDKSTHSKSYEQYNKSNVSRGVVMELSKSEFEDLLAMPCYYCKCFPSGANGIDRLNSSLMYTKQNCVACCKTCNHLKLKLTLLEFKEKLLSIFNTCILKTPQQYDNPRNTFIALLSSYNFKITNDSLLRLYDNETYYYSRMFRNFTIEDIKRIKVRMTFIKPSTMKEEMSVWKFYKRKISSLKIREGHQNVGRRIYILVQDETTNCDLGIISLTSDIKNVKARDTYIGWTREHQYDYKRLQHIMNLSTCVSTQPFGFNTNGGKLLTALAFSKEVYQYVFDKYNTHLQGITTMSIYGKSIQYDRLPQLKFVGYTNGNTTSAIPQEVIDYMKQLEPNINDTLYLTKHICSKFDIPIEDLTRGIRKGIYFGYTHPDSKEYLCTSDELNMPNPIMNAYSIEQITEWWKTRWALRRFNHLIETKRVITDYQDVKSL